MLAAENSDALSIREMLDEVVSKLCISYDDGDESWRNIERVHNEVPSCSEGNGTDADVSESLLMDNGAEEERAFADDQRIKGRYRMGVGAFLQQDFRARKRNRAEVVEEASRSCAVADRGEIDRVRLEEIPKKVAKWEFLDVKEIVRERGIFTSKSVADYGFSVDNSFNNYLKSCKWSSSNSCYLSTTSQDRIARIFRFDPEHNSLKLNSSMGLGDLIYDSCWHPSNDWLATSSKDHPIHIWDSDGQRLATFRGINNMDELASAYSLCFASDGSILYAGYNNIIRKFDMSRPGPQVSEVPTWSKESKGQKGIVSCIAINPVLPSNYAVGSYGRTVGFYSDYSPGVECLFECQRAAVTWIRYTPDGSFLLTAGRKDDDIICWDLRYPGKIYGLYRRPSTTNQRVYFDIDSSGTYLFSGSSTGELFIFDLKCTSSDEPVIPFARLPAHRSALCGVSIWKEEPVVATCSGQRIFPYPELDSRECTSAVTAYEDTCAHENLDNSLALWSFQQ